MTFCLGKKDQKIIFSFRREHLLRTSSVTKNKKRSVPRLVPSVAPNHDPRFNTKCRTKKKVCFVPTIGILFCFEYYTEGRTTENFYDIIKSTRGTPNNNNKKKKKKIKETNMNSVSSDPVQELYKVIALSSATSDEKNGIKNCLNLVLLQQDYKLNTIKENVIVALNFDYGIGDTSTAMPMSMPSSASAAAAGTSSAAAAAAAAGTAELSLRQRHYHRACHDDAPSNYDAFKITKNEEERYRNTHTTGSVLSIDRISELLTGLITQSTPMYIHNDFFRSATQMNLKYDFHFTRVLRVLTFLK
ncbi:hypothetical protein FRACYDRAFT_238423 [Fragilariopsis cylindrus CCMP1102]|uniref:Uncharacterized protein n=1 Tax=Fragilariopsis cylindrus CCMP1102 TaxID=635003 RepID=A0A1E7FIJ0_9STRA|nr:hypothetical protein FRACYDRAFT_238423 [Fragilariopsis cylindrus CCMP1102]|eukprot:OEU17992.1 hypothetical protein FRACYDRAFT_238423 [Fragilariopsis cylindrus CCMP1102]